VTLDAYGVEVPFEATVVSVDPAETIRDGVSTYRAILQFSEQDERIRSGMTANVIITADRREGVIAIPQGAIISRDGKKIVRIKVGEETLEREVTVGEVSSIGSTEITSGLSEGDRVVISP
jgi:multidrug efflux pump subunit AcrA (membrane-fusion protein)